MIQKFDLLICVDCHDPFADSNRQIGHAERHFRLWTEHIMIELLVGACDDWHKGGIRFEEIATEFLEHFSDGEGFDCESDVVELSWELWDAGEMFAVEVWAGDGVHDGEVEEVS